MEYRAEDFRVSIKRDEYVRRFRDAERIMGYCKGCPNYAKSWACPPLSQELDDLVQGYPYLRLIATKIIPTTQNLPLSKSSELIRPERIRLEHQLLEMEKQFGGRSFAFVGTCLYCPENRCSRLQGKPCRHPDLVRPSLEAYGFDIGQTTSKLFGIDLLWGKDGLLPEYLTIVCGFFHNNQALYRKDCGSRNYESDEGALM